MTEKIKTESDGTAYYLSLFDLDGLPKMLRSEVASWVDRDEIWLKGPVSDEYALITAESEKQLLGRVDMLTNSSFIDDVEVIKRQKGLV